MWEGVIKVFRDYGYRRLRNKARLKFLVADWGAEKFREVLETEYLKRPLIDGPAAARARPSAATTSASTRRTTAWSTSGAAPTVGRIAGRSCARSPTWPTSTAAG